MALDWTGERFLPGVGAEIAYEHYNRYLFAREHVKGKIVLDVPSGEGFGSAILARDAKEVVGIDISEEAVMHARAAYTEGVTFHVGSMTNIKQFEDQSVDVVTCFEGIEHISAEDQVLAIAEFSRVLKKTGILFVSSPNKQTYSDDRNYVNPFHVREYYYDDFVQELTAKFPFIQTFGQKIFEGSIISPLNSSGINTFKGEELQLRQTETIRDLPGNPNAYLYLIAICGFAPEVKNLNVGGFVSDFELALRSEVLGSWGHSEEKNREAIVSLKQELSSSEIECSALRHELAAEKARLSYRISKKIVSFWIFLFGRRV